MSDDDDVSTPATNIKSKKGKKGKKKLPNPTNTPVSHALQEISPAETSTSLTTLMVEAHSLAPLTADQRRKARDKIRKNKLKLLKKERDVKRKLTGVTILPKDVPALAPKIDDATTNSGVQKTTANEPGTSTLADAGTPKLAADKKSVKKIKPTPVVTTLGTPPAIPADSAWRVFNLPGIFFLLIF